ncbi:MAG: Ada metal-binding domain-containing protein [Spirosomataceae bacterium]
MVHHLDLTSEEVKKYLKNGALKLGGNRPLRIYGTLHCKAGKRMKIENRVFFGFEEEAILAGFRPCGQCMREKYKAWKAKNKTHFLEENKI